MKNILLISVLLLSGCASVCTGGWTKEDTALELASEGLLQIDWQQTRNLHYPFYETNPLLGKYPSPAKVNVYFATWLVVHPIMSCALPPKYRHIFQGLTIAVEGKTTLSNHNLK